METRPVGGTLENIQVEEPFPLPVKAEEEVVSPQDRPIPGRDRDIFPGPVPDSQWKAGEIPGGKNILPAALDQNYQDPGRQEKKKAAQVCPPDG